LISANTKRSPGSSPGAAGGSRGGARASGVNSLPRKVRTVHRISINGNHGNTGGNRTFTNGRASGSANGKNGNGGNSGNPNGGNGAGSSFRRPPATLRMVPMGSGASNERSVKR